MPIAFSIIFSIFPRLNIKLFFSLFFVYTMRGRVQADHINNEHNIFFDIVQCAPMFCVLFEGKKEKLIIALHRL